MPILGTQASQISGHLGVNVTTDCLTIAGGGPGGSGIVIIRYAV